VQTLAVITYGNVHTHIAKLLRPYHLRDSKTALPLRECLITLQNLLVSSWWTPIYFGLTPIRGYYEFWREIVADALGNIGVTLLQYVFPFARHRK
jgi:hypothetical protein